MAAKGSPYSKKKEKWSGGLALVEVLDKGGSAELVCALLAAFPDAAKQKAANGRLPLMVAINKRSDFAVVDAVLSHFPAATRKAHLRKLPIHMAAEDGACGRSIQALLDDAPECVKVKYYQRLPLHIVLESFGPRANVEVVQTLLRAYRESAMLQFNGRLPLTMAVEARAHPLVVKLLLEAYPEIMKKREFQK